MLWISKWFSKWCETIQATAAPRRNFPSFRCPHSADNNAAATATPLDHMNKWTSLFLCSDKWNQSKEVPIIINNVPSILVTQEQRTDEVHLSMDTNRGPSTWLPNTLTKWATEVLVLELIIWSPISQPSIYISCMIGNHPCKRYDKLLRNKALNPLIY